MPTLIANQFMRVSPSGLVEVAIAFAIDLAKHARHLERHGVKVEI